MQNVDVVSIIHLEGCGCLSQWPRGVGRWDNGFESQSMHVFVCCVVCVGRGLATGRSPAQETYQTYKSIHSSKSSK